MTAILEDAPDVLTFADTKFQRIVNRLLQFLASGFGVDEPLEVEDEHFRESFQRNATRNIDLQ